MQPPQRTPAASEPALSAEHVRLLARVPLFAHLDNIALAQVAAYLEPLVFAQGTAVCHQEEPSDCLYVIAEGTFAVLVHGATGTGETRLGELGPGEYFGEMGLLTGEPRSATVRAEGEGQVLRLGRERFLDLLQAHPEQFLSLIATISQRLRTTNREAADSQRLLTLSVTHGLELLPGERRRHVLEASVLETASPMALAILFGPTSTTVAEDLAGLGLEQGGDASPVVHALREALVAKLGAENSRALAEQSALRLAAAGEWEGALSVLCAWGLREPFLAVFARALRGMTPLSRDRVSHWCERLSDEEASRDAEVALFKAAIYERRGEAATAAALLQRAVGATLVRGDAGAGQRLVEEVTRLTGHSSGFTGGLRYGLAPAAGATRHWPLRSALVLAPAAALLVAAVVLGAGRPELAFGLLLGAAIVLWVGDMFPAAAVGLGLVAAWVVLGVSQPAVAMAGFGSMDWAFVVAILGLAAGTARSGLLYRVGLLLVRRMPRGLFWQAGTLLLTGIMLSPLLPMAMGRATLTSPLATGLADALRLRRQEPAAAVLGLAAWVGAGPLLFMFLNGSPACLIVWALLPETSRQRFDWLFWVTAAAPLGIFVALGTLILLFLLLRPGNAASPSRERLDLQLALLGPLSRREWAMLAVLILTVGGWLFSPAIGLDFATVALLGLVAVVATGNLDRQVWQGLDWNYLVFYGVILSLSRLATSLGIDRLVAAAVGPQVTQFGASPLLFILAIALVVGLLRLALLPEQALLLSSLAFIPLAPAVGVDPWIAVIPILTMCVIWYLPSQSPEYLVAYSSAEGRLYSHEQGRLAALAYTAVVIVGLTLSVPYWHLLGLL